MNCEFCQKPTHVWFECPNKPDGWKPGRLAKKSTAARKDVQKNPDPGSSIPTAQDQGLVNGAAGTQALPVDAPKPKFDRNAYQREYMRKRRAEQREYRARKK